MIKRKLQDLTACCAYNVNFLHSKEHGWSEFRRQYALNEEIGRGGFGVVYGGKRINDDLPVAIKYIEHRHVREWTLAGSHLIPSEVSHLEMCADIPGVIKLLGWFANSKGFVVVMERLPDCIDLFDLVARYGKLDEPTARQIFSQVVETVCTMYARYGLIHRDIKDENIIISMQTGEVRLVDFGATTQCDKAFKREFQGTRSYCPPEWFRLLQYMPLEATSWSLGILLFILVTGHLPFKNEIQICLGSIKFPTHLTKDVCCLIKRCLSTVPTSRASLLEIRGHPWLAKTHSSACSESTASSSSSSDTFQAQLDRRLQPKRRHSAARHESLDENQMQEDVLPLSEQRFATAIPVSVCAHSKASTSKEDPSETPLTSSISACRISRASEPRSALTRESSVYLEAVESQMPMDTSMVGMSRLSSRYDNVSASSLGDYFSLASYDPTLATSLPSPAFENSFASSVDVEADASEEVSDSLSHLKNRSFSAYSLSRRRRSLLPRSSFERELDTVEETGNDDCSPSHHCYQLPPSCSSPSLSSSPSRPFSHTGAFPPPSPRSTRQVLQDRENTHSTPFFSTTNLIPSFLSDCSAEDAAGNSPHQPNMVEEEQYDELPSYFDSYPTTSSYQRQRQSLIAPAPPSLAIFYTNQQPISHAE